MSSEGALDTNLAMPEIAAYWNEHIHDLDIANHPAGTAEFFNELERYRFDKLRYLSQVVDFAAFRQQRLLEVGCGVGIDLARFARAGALVTGIDVAPVAIYLAQLNFSHRCLNAAFQVMNGEEMAFADKSFDAVYAHGVLPYTADPETMVAEIHRVLRPGGTAIMMVYNRYSWLNALSGLTGVPLEHEDAPVLRKYSIAEFRNLLACFDRVRIVPERFPVRTRLQRGLKARLYNGLFVGLFNALPRWFVRPSGWHLMGFATKGRAQEA